MLFQCGTYHIRRQLKETITRNKQSPRFSSSSFLYKAKVNRLFAPRSSLFKGCTLQSTNHLFVTDLIYVSLTSVGLIWHIITRRGSGTEVLGVNQGAYF